MPLFSLNFDYDIANLCESLPFFSLFMCKPFRVGCNKKRAEKESYCSTRVTIKYEKKRKYMKSFLRWHDCFILCDFLLQVSLSRVVYKEGERRIASIWTAFCPRMADNDNKKCLFFISVKCSFLIFHFSFVLLSFAIWRLILCFFFKVFASVWFRLILFF